VYVQPPVAVRVVVDMATHRKVYIGRYGVTYDVFCAVADLSPKEQRARLKLLGVPRDNPKVRRE